MSPGRQEVDLAAAREEEFRGRVGVVVERLGDVGETFFGKGQYLFVGFAKDYTGALNPVFQLPHKPAERQLVIVGGAGLKVGKDLQPDSIRGGYLVDWGGGLIGAYQISEGRSLSLAAATENEGSIIGYPYEGESVWDELRNEPRIVISERISEMLGMTWEQKQENFRLMLHGLEKAGMNTG